MGPNEFVTTSGTDKQLNAPPLLHFEAQAEWRSLSIYRYIEELHTFVPVDPEKYEMRHCAVVHLGSLGTACRQ